MPKNGARGFCTVENDLNVGAETAQTADLGELLRRNANSIDEVGHAPRAEITGFGQLDTVAGPCGVVIWRSAMPIDLCVFR